jgi:pimeloyl-ACP methyl ester carboxylesterase
MAISGALGERRTVELPAGTVEYRERGEGAPVLFAHGAAVNGDLWRNVAPAVAGRHRIIVPDLPLGGHATPLRSDADMSLFGLADLLASFIESLDLSDVTLVANNTGGAISQALIGRRPELVNRLVLTSCDAWDTYPPKAIRYLKPTTRVAPALWLLSQTMRFKRTQRLPIAYGWATHRPIEPEIMESFLSSLRTTSGVRRDFAKLLQAADTRDMAQASESVTAFEGPALVVWAADDKFFPRAHGQRLAEQMPNARFELADNSRTFIPEDNPVRLLELVQGFLAEGTVGLRLVSRRRRRGGS